MSGNYDNGVGNWNSRSVKYIFTNRTYTGMLVQGKEERVVEATHEPLVDSRIFDAIQKTFQSRSYNVVPQGQPVDNILKGKVVCGCCNGKMQRKRGTNHADWYFFTCITKNRLGTDKCTRGEISKEALQAALDAAHEAKVMLAEVSERKEAYEKEYSIFRKLLSATDKRTSLSEIMDYIEKIVVDAGKKIVVKCNIS